MSRPSSVFDAHLLRQLAKKCFDTRTFEAALRSASLIAALSLFTTLSLRSSVLASALLPAALRLLVLLGLAAVALLVLAALPFLTF